MGAYFCLVGIPMDRDGAYGGPSVTRGATGGGRDPASGGGRPVMTQRPEAVPEGPHSGGSGAAAVAGRTWDGEAPVMRCRELPVALASQLTPTAGSVPSRGGGDDGGPALSPLSTGRVTRLFADYVLAEPAARVDYVRLRNHYVGHLCVSARFSCGRDSGGEAGAPRWVPLVRRMKLMGDMRAENEAEMWHLVPLPPPPPSCSGSVEALRVYLGQPNPEFFRTFAVSHVAFYAAVEDGGQSASKSANFQEQRDLERVEALFADPVGDIRRHAAAMELYFTHTGVPLR